MKLAPRPAARSAARRLARWLSVAAAVVALAVPALASAQGKASAKAAKPPAAAEDGRSYEYKFEDDLMKGGGLDSGSPIIRVSAHAVRSQLIQPRTNFVPELFKSAEGF